MCCSANHRSRDHHSPEEVNAALEKLKRKGNMYVCIEDVVHYCEEIFDNDVSRSDDDLSEDEISDENSFGLPEVSVLLNKN